MADTEFVTALHTKTGIVSSVPRRYVESDSLFPGVYKELSEAQVVELRRKEEKETFGEYVTPAPKSAAAKKEGDK
jgi:hypothetical protein